MPVYEIKRTSIASDINQNSINKFNSNTNFQINSDNILHNVQVNVQLNVQINVQNNVQNIFFL